MRPIDASKLVRKLCDISSNNDEFGRGVAVGVSTVITEILKQPTLTLDDLRPKGRWEPNEPERDVWFHCSECGTDISTSWDYDCDEMWNCCPHCGADMRGGGEDA